MILIIILLGVGCMLIAAEIFLPGGVAGALGGLCIAAAVGVGYAELGADGGNVLLGIVVVGGVLGALFWLRYFPHSRLARRFVAHGVAGEVTDDRTALLGSTGTSSTPLRPSGSAEINGERVAVVTEGEFVEAGVPVVVIRVDGNRVLVRPAHK